MQFMHGVDELERRVYCVCTPTGIRGEQTKCILDLINAEASEEIVNLCSDYISRSPVFHIVTNLRMNRNQCKEKWGLRLAIPYPD